jgi:hypothetical protein
VTASGSGGATPYTYQMGSGLPFSSVNTIGVLPSSIGTFVYTGVTVRDNSGQMMPATCFAQVVGPPPITGACLVNGQSTPLSLQVGNQATFFANASGGTGALHYAWSLGGADSNALSPIFTSPGIFNVLVTVSDSATNTQRTILSCPQVTVNAPPPVSAFCNISPNPINLGTGATLSAGALGGYPPYQFILPGSGSFGSSASTLVSPTSVGTANYLVSAKDNIGQTNTSSCSVQVNGVAPSVTGFNWTSAPRNRINFSGSVSGGGFVSAAAVWFCTTGTNTCFQHPSAGVVVQDLGTIQLTNVNLTSGNWQIEVRTPYGSGRSGTFAVNP